LEYNSEQESTYPGSGELDEVHVFLIKLTMLLTIIDSPTEITNPAMKANQPIVLIIDRLRKKATENQMTMLEIASPFLKQMPLQFNQHS